MENYHNLSQTLENMTVRAESQNRYSNSSTVLYHLDNLSGRKKKNTTDQEKIAEQREIVKNRYEVTLAFLERQRIAVLGGREKYADEVKSHSWNLMNQVEGDLQPFSERDAAVGQVNITGHSEVNAILGKAKQQLAGLLM